MTYFFANREPIDLAAIELMGVSVKAGTSPIGYFGTGLKFAIATCLRHGQGVTLTRSGVEYRFGLTIADVRGKEFDRVVMIGPDGPVPLGFTTQLGKNWQLWQAYREFESNTRDESGVSGEDVYAENFPWGTLFEIEGEAFAEAARTAGVFLATKPLYTSGIVEIHPLGPNPRAVYHKGVLAGELPKPGLFTYNDLSGTLTEDRTLQSLFSVGYWAGDLLAEKGSKVDLERALLADANAWERDAFINFSTEPNEAFGEVVREHRLDKQLNGVAKNRWLQMGENATSDWTKVELTAQHLATARDALVLARRMGAPLGLEDFSVVSGLGPGVYGCVSRGKIYISPSTFDMGSRFLASTLYEEWLHLHEHLVDESRAMQAWLFERLSATTEALMEREKEMGVTGEVIRVPTYEADRTFAADTLSLMPIKPTRLIDDDIPF